MDLGEVLCFVLALVSSCFCAVRLGRVEEKRGRSKSTSDIIRCQRYSEESTRSDEADTSSAYTDADERAAQEYLDREHILSIPRRITHHYDVEIYRHNTDSSTIIQVDTKENDVLVYRQVDGFHPAARLTFLPSPHPWGSTSLEIQDGGCALVIRDGLPLPGLSCSARVIAKDMETTSIVLTVKKDDLVLLFVSNSSTEKTKPWGSLVQVFRRQHDRASLLVRASMFFKQTEALSGIAIMVK